MSKKSQKRLEKRRFLAIEGFDYLGRFVKNGGNGNSVGHDSSGLVEGVDFSEKLLEIVLPAELVAEESVLDRVC